MPFALPKNPMPCGMCHSPIALFSKKLLKNGGKCVIIFLYRGCRIFRLQGARTPQAGCRAATRQPPAVFFIHREQRKPISTAIIPYPAAARHSCRPTWLFPPDFFFLRAKNRAGTQSAAPHGKFHDEKAYFRKTSCQNRGNVISYRQGAGYPVVGCSYTLQVCRAATRQAAFFVYVIMLA